MGNPCQLPVLALGRSRDSYPTEVLDLDEKVVKKVVVWSKNTKSENFRRRWTVDISGSLRAISLARITGCPLPTLLCFRSPPYL
jgi:hypothetical protein